MADPLSVAASIVGILTAAAQVSLLLQKLYSKSKHAPQAIQDLKAEVDNMSRLLTQLQLYVLRKAKAKPSREALVLLEHVQVVLGSCVLTFSDLETMVESFDTDQKLGIMDRVRWITKTSDVADMTNKVQSHKTSFMLMLQILQSQSQLEAENSVDQLTSMVRSLLDSYPVIDRRLSNEEMPPASSSATHEAERPQRQLSFTRAFEADLHDSWVYKRVLKIDDDNTLSIMSSAGRTASWSMLSGLSMSEISFVAVLALPIYAEDLQNKQRYDFNESKRPRKDLGSRWRQFRSRIVESTVPEKPPAIFGRALADLDTLYFEIHTIPRSGTQVVLPLVVAQLGSALTKTFPEEPSLFTAFLGDGDALRMYAIQQDIEVSAASSQLRAFRWPGLSTKFDVAGCLLRYLKMLPDPIIPTANYGDFIDASKQELVDDIGKFQNELRFAEESSALQRSTTRRLARARLNLPSRNRDLLDYILNLMGSMFWDEGFGVESKLQLISAFQPSILDPGELYAHHPKHEDYSVILLMLTREYYISEQWKEARNALQAEVDVNRSERSRQAWIARDRGISTSLAQARLRREIAAQEQRLRDHELTRWDTTLGNTTMRQLTECMLYIGLNPTGHGSEL